MPGKVLHQEAILENVHVNNVSTRKYAVTNKEGLFTINTRVGDTLVLSHIGMDDLIVFLTIEKVELNLPVFYMEAISNQLDEVLVKEGPRIDAVSERIIPKKIVRLSENERRLKTAGDFKPIHLLGILVGNLQLDPILNAINGRTKKLKRNIVIEKEIITISLLENNYAEFMQENFTLKEGEMHVFIDFLLQEKELQAVVDSKNKGRMELFLIESWSKYRP